MFAVAPVIFIGGLFLLGLLFIVNSLFYIWRWRDYKGLFLGNLLLVLGLMSLHAGLLKSGQILKVPLLLGADIIIAAFGHICIVLGLTSLIEVNFRWKHLYWLLFLYPALQLFFYSPFLFLSVSEQTDIVKVVLSGGDHAFYFSAGGLYIHAIALSLTFAYVFLIFFIRLRWKRVPQKYRLKVALGGGVWFLFILFNLAYRIKFSVSHVGLTTFSAADYLLYYVILYIFFQFWQIWPYYFKHGAVYFDTKTFKMEKYFTRHLDRLDLGEIRNRIEHSIKIQELHRDDNMNIAVMAKSIGINQYQLSVFLNRYLNQTFSEFINSRRIEDAKSILLEHPEKSILDICYEVGYNSPSVFYRAFKKETGFSPREWLKKKARF